MSVHNPPPGGVYPEPPKATPAAPQGKPPFGGSSVKPPPPVRVEMTDKEKGALEWCYCARCGFEWQRGTSNRHDCNKGVSEMAELRDQFALAIAPALMATVGRAQTEGLLGPTMIGVMVWDAVDEIMAARDGASKGTD